MNSIWNYPLSKREIHYSWRTNPFRKRAGIRSLNTQEKIEILIRRMQADQNHKEN